MSDTSAGPKRAASPLRVLVYLVLGAAALTYALLPRSPRDDGAGLLAQVQAAEHPAGKYQVGSSAAHVYNLGAGYVLTLRVEGDATFGEDCFFVVERLFGQFARAHGEEAGVRPGLAGQLLRDTGEGVALTTEQVEDYLAALKVDLAPWDAVCAGGRGGDAPAAVDSGQR